MSDTPTAALATALHAMYGLDAPWHNALVTPCDAHHHDVDAMKIVAALTAAGWQLVPSGSLLDMARAVVALANAMDDYGSAYLKAVLMHFPDAIAAAREMVAAEPGT